MAYRIELKSSAVDELARLPRAEQNRIRRRIDALAENPRPVGCQKLARAGQYFRIRAGVYRVIYEIMDERLVVMVIRVGHRRDVYRGM